MKTIGKSTAGRAGVLASILLQLVAGGAIGANDRVVLSGHATASMANVQPVAHVAASTTIPLAIILPCRNQAGLDDAIRQMYDPKSKLYHHFLTTAQFTAQYGPSLADYETVERYAVANGLTVTGRTPNRLLLDVSGTAANVERAFNVHLNNYAYQGRTVRFPDAQPSVPAFVAPMIAGVAGLDNADVRKPDLAPPSLMGVMNTPSAAGPSMSGQFLSAPAGGMTPAGIKTLYNFASLPQDGTGQVCGLFELDGYTPSDIPVFENYYGLPHVTLQNVLVDGASATSSGQGGQIEVTMDMDIMLGLAPGMTKLMVYIGPNTTQGVLDTYNKMATDNQAKQMSSSWETLEINLSGAERSAENTIFAQMAAQGQSIYNSSGDNGAYCGSPWLLVGDPASQPYMCAVGGTVVSFSYSNYLWSSETTWSGSGGGAAVYEPLPSYQTGVGYSTSHRNVPDVSLDAAIGYSCYIDGAWQQWAGTSASAPAWGAFNALVNQKRIADGVGYLGLPMPTLYQIGASTHYNQDFHDIRDNTTNGFYHAITGYDDATGWGTINGAGLLPDLARNWASSAPSTPTGVTATANSATSITVSWQASSGANSYQVYRSQISGGPYTLVGSPSTTTLTDSALRPVSTYYYVVKAIADNYSSGLSSEASTMTTPLAPTGLRLKVLGLTEIDLTWMPATGATSYNVMRGTSTGGPYTNVGTASSTSYQDMAISAGTDYYYVVQAVDNGGASTNSNEAHGLTTTTAPSTLTATANGAAQIDLTWSASTGATSYWVMRSLRQSGPYTHVSTVSSATTYSDLHLAACTSYYYVIDAANAGGPSDPSPEASATTAPTPPAGLRAKANGSSEIDLAWTAVRGADSYVVKRGTSQGGPYSQVAQTSTAVCADQGISAATTYYYVVDAFSNGLSSADSAEVSCGTAPNAPGSLTANATGSMTVALTWPTSTGASSYGIFRSTVSGGPYTRTGTAMTNSFTASGMTSNVTYYFVVNAINSGGASGYSSEASATTLPTVPGGLKAKSVSGTEIDLTWPYAKGATGFIIRRGTSSGGPYTNIGTSSSLNYQDTGLSASTQYYYVIQSTNDGGPSGNSNEATATTMPDVPATVTASPFSSQQINLSWSAVTGATSYVLSKSLYSGGPYLKFGTASSTSSSVTGLVPGTSYYFVVAAVNVGGTGAASTEASATTLPPTPTGLHSHTVNAGEIDMSWAAPRGAGWSYTVLRGTVQGGPYSTVGMSDTPVYQDTAVTPATAYYYVVETTGNGGSSTNSNEATSTTAPSAPSSLTATTTGTTSIALTWPASTGATSYSVWRSKVSGTGYVKIGSTSSTSYNSLGLVTGTSYYYVVTSTGTGGTSGFSQEANATTN